MHYEMVTMIGLIIMPPYKFITVLLTVFPVLYITSPYFQKTNHKFNFFI